MRQLFRKIWSLFVPHVYEFGVYVGCKGADGDPEVENHWPQDYKPSIETVDLLDVVEFWKVPETLAPNGDHFRNIVTVAFRSGQTACIYYPYKDFKVLFERANGVRVQTMPHPPKN